jgi:hypothetical protein
MQKCHAEFGEVVMRALAAGIGVRVGLGVFALGVAFFGVFGLGSGFAQAPAPVSPEERFLREVARLSGAPRSGQNTGNVLGLSAGGVAALNTIAADCAADLQRVDQEINSSVFDARVRSVNGEDTSAVRARVRQLELARERRVAAYMDKLREMLGAAEFEKVSGYVRSRSEARYFFPNPATVGAAKKALRK